PTETRVVRKNRKLQKRPSVFNNLRASKTRILNFFSRPRRARRFHRGIRVLRVSVVNKALEFFLSLSSHNRRVDTERLPSSRRSRRNCVVRSKERVYHRRQ